MLFFSYVLFSTVTIFKRERGYDPQKILNVEFLASICHVPFSLSFHFYIAGVPVYNVVLGSAAACPVVFDFPRYSLKTHWWPF